VLLSIAGGSDLGLFEINEAARMVAEVAHPEANIIFGAVIDDALGDEVRVTVIAAGFDGGEPARMIDGFHRRRLADAEASAVDPVPAPRRSWNGDTAAVGSRPIMFTEDDDLDVPDFLK
jgi:cell division protein FtsZ